MDLGPLKSERNATNIIGRQPQSMPCPFPENRTNKLDSHAPVMSADSLESDYELFSNLRLLRKEQGCKPDLAPDPTSSRREQTTEPTIEPISTWKEGVST